VFFDDKNRVFMISDHITNESSSGFEKRTYNENGTIEKIELNTNNGNLKTRQIKCQYSFY